MVRRASLLASRVDRRYRPRDTLAQIVLYLGGRRCTLTGAETTVRGVLMRWLPTPLTLLLASAPIILATAAKALALDGFVRPPSQGCSSETGGVVTCPQPGFPLEYDVWRQQRSRTQRS
jgi:hypothetical protein